MSFDEAKDDYNARHPQARVESSRSERGDLVLVLPGELDMKATTDITPLLETAVKDCPARGRLSLDLSRVSYISSTGVGLLATIMVSAEKRSVTLTLLDIPPRVSAIMDTLGLLSYFNVGCSDGR